MSVKYPNSELAMDDRSNHNGSKERLGLSFTIDYLLFDRGARRTKEEATGSHATEQAENNTHQKPKLGKVEIHEEIQGKCLQQSDTGKSKACDEEGDEEQHEVGEEEVTTTIISTSRSAEKTADKPNQSYIALISKAILESDEKKLLLCDIYQWIMDHYPYFKNKDKNWRNSVRHNLSLNDCFIKADRSDNGKGHYWAIHPANYQDFSKGDYHCRRARRRVRKGVEQLRLSSLTSPYHPAATLAHSHRTTCWCCPQAQSLPLSCFTPRLYWSWPSIQPQVGLRMGLNASVP